MRTANALPIIISSAARRIGVDSLFLKRVAYFRLMLNSNMKEAVSGVIKMDHVQLDSMRGMLRFLYCGELAVEAENAIEVLEMAHTYELDDLKKRAEALIEQAFDFEDLESLLACYDLAHRLQAKHLIASIETCIKADHPPKQVREMLQDRENISKEAAFEISKQLPRI